LKNDIHGLIRWLEAEGDVEAFDRLRLRTLGEALDEGLDWSRIDRRTECSDALFARAKEVATEIVGKPCPL